MMSEVPSWEVPLFVDGPITLRGRRFSTTQQKGFDSDNPFYSDIEITSAPKGGLGATVTARASNERLAFKAAVFFFGRMLDVLAFKINLPLFVSLTEQGPSNHSFRHNSRRIIEPQEIEDAFRKADDLEMTQPPFLMSLSWYRKGLHTDDPLDKFLAFWIAIETVASNYYKLVESINQEKAKMGTKNQIYECFLALWGTREQWPMDIPSEYKWVHETNETRIDIAHGRKRVGIETVTSVVAKLDMVQRVAYRFLQDWNERFLQTDWTVRSEGLPDSDEEALTS